MQISMNTDMIQEMSVIANQVSQTIAEGTETIQRLFSHDDWYCKEKLTIDETVRTIQANSLPIKESAEYLSSYLSSVAEFFLNMIREEERDFAFIDSKFASIASILDGSGDSVVQCGSSTREACSVRSDTSQDIAVLNYLANADKPISIIGLY